MEETILTETNKNDIIVSISKGVLGAIPYIGPMLAEIVGNLIPNQRFERLKEFCIKIETRLTNVEQTILQAKMKLTEVIDLLEDSFLAASRALSDERLCYIANLLVEGIKGKKEEIIRFKKLLSILSNLNDIEVLWLYYYERLSKSDKTFYKLHENTLRPKLAGLGSSKEEREEVAIQEAYKSHLHELGLIRPHFPRVKSGVLPEFDEKTGMVKSNGYEITTLGRMLVQYTENVINNR
jgi:hypothetical protein